MLKSSNCLGRIPTEYTIFNLISDLINKNNRSGNEKSIDACVDVVYVVYVYVVDE